MDGLTLDLQILNALAALLLLLSFAMLVGRLELFTVFVLLLPRFWRQ